MALCSCPSWAVVRQAPSYPCLGATCQVISQPRHFSRQNAQPPTRCPTNPASTPTAPGKGKKGDIANEQLRRASSTIADNSASSGVETQSCPTNPQLFVIIQFVALVPPDQRCRSRKSSESTPWPVRVAIADKVSRRNENLNKRPQLINAIFPPHQSITTRFGTARPRQTTYKRILPEFDQY
ncbi:hypothetical protein B0T16DRAFT_126046 [Cercophora newfieldiana]|uniref:Uncharacterized protein n=1 Tax=Cercophora newfieldiana TaxID=92897 RepID=A0AA39YAN2_9PEZI|nr:hypothetical protein B0T16DRAFT_126046 [Cercophora newfieldiana]